MWQKAEFVKKSERTNSAFLLSCAKFDTSAGNKTKNIVFCDVLTRNTMFFCFVALVEVVRQIFFVVVCEKSCIKNEYIDLFVTLLKKRSYSMHGFP